MDLILLKCILGEKSIFFRTIYFNYHHRWKQVNKYGWCARRGEISFFKFCLNGREHAAISVGGINFHLRISLIKPSIYIILERLLHFIAYMKEKRTFKFFVHFCMGRYDETFQILPYQLHLPLNSPLPGSELTKEPFRWDQRLFALVLRLPGLASTEPEQLGSVPTDESAITQMCEVTGGIGNS